MAAVFLIFETLLQHGSYLGIVLFLILTGCGLPVPEEVPIVMAGVLSAQGDMHVWLAFFSCLAGALIGDCVVYGIGYHFGHNLLKRHPRFARFLHAEREAKFEQMIQAHGLKVLFVARFMVGVRSPVYLSAGILRVSFRWFLLTDLLCATLVVSLFFGIAYRFGHQIGNWIRNAEIGFTVTAVIAAVVGLAIYYWRARRRAAVSGQPKQIVGPGKTGLNRPPGKKHVA
ncbi:MAG: DedA family protein [Pirellulales bacterium]